jgi:hypothetical protein
MQLILAIYFIFTIDKFVVSRILFRGMHRLSPFPMYPSKPASIASAEKGLQTAFCGRQSAGERGDDVSAGIHSASR